MPILKLKPECKSYLWGGQRLKTDFHKESPLSPLAETWELSCHPDGHSCIINGEQAGSTLAEYIRKSGKHVLGRNCERFEDFPILIKFIDANDNLSIQVHPDNTYALEKEGQYGKTEMWYVLDAAPDAYLYYGFSREIDKEELKRRILENTLLEVLNKVQVNKGDVFFIEAGTIHAIGKGIVIAEIQQNSNVTYRVYDYNRLGADNKPRALHIDKALDVTRTAPEGTSQAASAPHLASCDYFTVDRISLDGKVISAMQGSVDTDSFISLLITEGSGTIENGGEMVSLQKGDSIFLPAGSGSFTIKGCMEILSTYIPPSSQAVRAGIDLGGTNIKIGLVTPANEILDSLSIPTLAERAPQAIIEDMAEAVKKLLARNNLSVHDCTGIGIGSPGTIDSKTGTVLYSNNIRWENVELAAMLGQLLPLPVKADNDANCAALGEAKAGAAKGCQDVALLTLGTGVGGGIIYKGQLIPEGGELGHIMLEKDGRQCTCGRKGCVEAYASASALIRDARDAAASNPDSLLNSLCGNNLEAMNAEIPFTAAKLGDLIALGLIDDYTRALGELVTDIVNFYHPEKVLLGGGVCAQGDYLIRPIQDYVEKNAFGHKFVRLPQILRAELSNSAGIIGAANLV